MSHTFDIISDTHVGNRRFAGEDAFGFQTGSHGCWCFTRKEMEICWF